MYSSASPRPGFRRGAQRSQASRRSGRRPKSDKLVCIDLSLYIYKYIYIHRVNLGLIRVNPFLLRRAGLTPRNAIWPSAARAPITQRGLGFTRLTRHIYMYIVFVYVYIGLT